MITIIIPTFSSRTFFLKRLLHYYRNVLCEYTIVIADSSESFHKKLNKNIIDSLARYIDIQYYSFDMQIGWIEKINIVINKITTPYVVINADDDFIVPSSARKIVEFLEDNKDFSIAHGFATAFKLNKRKNIDLFEIYPQSSITQEFSSQRLISHLQNYASTFYSVHRISDLRKNLKIKYSLGDLDFRYEELLPSCMSVVQGKSMKIDCLYMVREAHNFSTTKDHLSRYVMPDWIADPNWSKNYQKFRYTLAEELTQCQGINFEAARKVVRIALFSYILKSGLGIRFSESKKKEEEFSLDNLLQPASKYHNDFMPIYNTIITDLQQNLIESDEFLGALLDFSNNFDKIKQDEETYSFLAKYRYEIAQRFLELNNEEVCNFYSGNIGKVHNIFCKSKLNNLPLLDSEKTFVKRLVQDLNKKFKTKPIQYSLAAKLYSNQINMNS